MDKFPETTRKTFNIDHLSSNIPDIFRRMGCGDALSITERGRPAAELRPVVSDDSPSRPIGLRDGEFAPRDDFDDPLSENILPDLQATSRGESSTSDAKECVTSPTEDDVSQSLDRVYTNESSTLDTVVARMQWLSLPKEDW